MYQAMFYWSIIYAQSLRCPTCCIRCWYPGVDVSILSISWDRANSDRFFHGGSYALTSIGPLIPPFRIAPSCLIGDDATMGTPVSPWRANCFSWKDPNWGIEIRMALGDFHDFTRDVRGSGIIMETLWKYFDEYGRKHFPWNTGRNISLSIICFCSNFENGVHHEICTVCK